jgi:hypothetical protein
MPETGTHATGAVRRATFSSSFLRPASGSKIRSPLGRCLRLADEMLAIRNFDTIECGFADSSSARQRPAASPFVCLLNMSAGQVNLVLGPETHNGADKKSGMRAMTRTNSGTGPFVLILRAIKSGFSRYWNE